MARPPILLRFKGDSRGLQTAGRDAQRALQGVTTELQQTGRMADRLDGKSIDLSVKADGFVKLRAQLQTQLAALENTDITPDVDPLKVIAQIRKVNAALGTLDRQQKVTVDVDVDRGRMGSMLAGAFGSVAEGLTPTFARTFETAIGAGLQQAGSAASASGPIAAGIAGVAAQIGVLASPFIISAVSSAAGLGAGMGLLKLLDSYDQLQKAQKKADVVFAAQLGGIEQWASGLSSAVGLGRQEIVGLAAGVQDLMVPKGFGRGQAAGITKLIVERGAALAEFQGRETSEGIEAITGALLGQTRQLKSFGVEVNADLLKSRQALVESRGYWLDYGRDGVRSADDVRRSVQGLTGEQLKVVAALELIQERSTDAFRAFREGTGTADDVLDFLNASLANFKTTAVEGFGSLLVEMLDEIRGTANIDLSFSDGGLARWIQQNRQEIKGFFYDVAVLSLQSVEGLIQFAAWASNMVGPTLDAANALTYFAQAQALGAAASLAMIGQWGAAKEMLDLSGEMGQARTDIEAWKTAWKTANEAIQENAPKALAKVRALREEVMRSKEFSRINWNIRVAAREGDISKVRDLLKGLSKQELKYIIADTKGSEKPAAKILNDLARERYAKITPRVDSLNARTILDQLTRKEVKEIVVNVKDQNGNPIRVPGITGQGGQTITRSVQTVQPAAVAPVVVQMQDGRLADFIAASVDGTEAQIRRTWTRRYGNS